MEYKITGIKDMHWAVNMYAKQDSSKAGCILKMYYMLAQYLRQDYNSKSCEMFFNEIRNSFNHTHKIYINDPYHCLALPE